MRKTIFAPLLLLALSCAGCRGIIRALLPKRPHPPSYWSTVVLPEAEGPDWMDFAEMEEEERAKHVAETRRKAQALSEGLEAHVRAWLAGEAPARIPADLLPPAFANEKVKDWTLCRPGEVSAEAQWIVRPAERIPKDHAALHFLSPDNHCTYGKLLFLAPFGSKLVLQGDFPHCRFFDLQITPPFDPETICPVVMGAPEVPIVDVDIDPEPGHVNPFREGARRDAKRRRYRVVFDLVAGDPVALNKGAYEAPAYRAPGNVRAGSPISYAGPVGLGALVPGLLWLRYYAPDRGTGPLAGVPLPAAHLELPSGERFWVRCDQSLAEARQNRAVAGFPTEPEDPPDFLGPEVGWWKMFGIWLVIAEGNGYALSQSWLVRSSWAKRFVRNADRKLFGRGPDMPAPGNYECSSTCCNYINYLVRPISLGKGKVIVLTGKLPETPKTRDGEPVAETAECRYWSLCRTADSPDKAYPMILYGSLMDDEIVLDDQRRFVIAFSRKEDRPANAVAEAGVTWQDWGPPAMQVMNVRWLSVAPGDCLPGRTPDEINLPWERCAWSQPGYDESLIGRNHESGFLGDYKPEIHYLTREAFEALGSAVEPDEVPAWGSEGE